MEEQKKPNEQEATVPFYVYDGAMVRAYRYFRSVLVALVIALALLVINNICWMRFVSKQHPVETTVETEVNEVDDEKTD